MPFVAFHHAGQHQARKLQKSPQVNVDQFIDIALAGTQDIPGTGDTGAVHEDVHFPAGDSLRYRCSVCQIDGVRNGTGPLGQLDQGSFVPCERCTSRPLLAKCPAIAAPIPVDAPVTTAVE
jgi:hypothetical protein